MKISLTTHKYAPELNEVFLNGVPFKGVDKEACHSIRDVRIQYFQPVKSGKYVKVTQFNEDHPCLNDRVVLRGYFRNYEDLLSVFRDYKERNACDEVPGSTFKFDFKIIGNGSNPFIF